MDRTQLLVEDVELEVAFTMDYNQDITVQNQQLVPLTSGHKRPRPNQVTASKKPRLCVEDNTPSEADVLETVKDFHTSTLQALVSADDCTDDDCCCGPHQNSSVAVCRHHKDDYCQLFAYIERVNENRRLFGDLKNNREAFQLDIVSAEASVFISTFTQGNRGVAATLTTIL